MQLHMNTRKLALHYIEICKDFMLAKPYVFKDKRALERKLRSRIPVSTTRKTKTVDPASHLT